MRNRCRVKKYFEVLFAMLSDVRLLKKAGSLSQPFFSVYPLWVREGYCLVSIFSSSDTIALAPSNISLMWVATI